MPVELRADLATVAGGLGDLVHRAGVRVTPERSARLAQSIALAAPVAVDELYWLARVTLLSSVTDIPTFDRVFQQLFGGLWDPADFRGDPNATGDEGRRAASSRAGPAPVRLAAPASDPTPSLAAVASADGDDRRCRVGPRRVERS